MEADEGHYLLPTWWCGKEFEVPIMKITISPCWLESAAAIILPVLLIGSILTSAPQLRRVSYLLAEGKRSKATTATEGMMVAAACFMTSMHTLHTALAVLVPEIKPFVFHACWNASATACWLACLIIQVCAWHLSSSLVSPASARSTNRP